MAPSKKKASASKEAFAASAALADIEASRTGEDPKPVKRTRKVLTPEEKVAKLEADLAAARQKIADKDVERKSKLYTQLEKQTERRDEAQSKISALEAELDMIDARLNAGA